MDLDEAAKQFRDFVEVIRALRTPETGCPWDLEQDHHTLRPYLLEEVCEVLETIDRRDDPALREELGDLLLQVVLHAQVACDRRAFTITEVVQGITEKMIRRHPHVFGTTEVSGSEEVLHRWEQIKAAEAKEKGQTSSGTSGLDRIPADLPALHRAQRLGEKSAKIGVDAASIPAILATLCQHFASLEASAQMAAGDRPTPGARPPDELRTHLEQQMGEVLFDLCQLARWLGIGAEESLRAHTLQFLDQARSKADQPEESQ